MALVSQMRIYRIREGLMDEWLELFHDTLVPLHHEVGIPVPFASRNTENPHEFVWVRQFHSAESVQHQEQEFFSNPARVKLGDVRGRYVESLEVRVLEELPLPGTGEEGGAIESNLPQGIRLAGELVGEDFDGWSDDIKAEFEQHKFDGHVGSTLLSEDERVRVWEIRLAPGQRWHAHRHVLDYFWTAVTAGKSLQHTADGTTRVVEYEAGMTRHYTFGPGEFLLHDIANAGESELVFTTVEHLNSANDPLPLT